MNNFNEKIKELHSLDLNDSEIAKQLNVSSTFVRSRRLEMNLPLLQTIKRNKILEKILELSKENMSDREIGEVLNLNYRTIASYRSKISLPPSMPENNYKNDSDRIKGYMIRNSKFTSKRRNIFFDLHYSDIELPIYCPLLNIKLTYRSESDGNHFSHATLDRIDNTKGYIKGNIIVLSRLANCMKNSANFEEIILFCSNIQTLINFYKIQGALGSITDVFPDTELYQED